MDFGSFSSLSVEQEDGSAIVTLERADKLNALSSAVLDQLRRCFLALDAVTEERPRAAILTGAGDKAFVAGADIEEMRAMSVEEARAFSHSGHELARVMERCAFPIIAAVHGFALGGGCELALACDFIVCSDKAVFGQPEVKLGLMPGFGGTQRLARRIGLGRARQWIYTGDLFNAAAAERAGLVNEVVSVERLLPRAKEIARTIATRAPLAVAASKRAMRDGYDVDLDTAGALETTAFAALFGSDDARTGLDAFLNKRKAEFRAK